MSVTMVVVWVIGLLGLTLAFTAGLVRLLVWRGDMRLERLGEHGERAEPGTGRAVPS
jgi:hypothetical protein